MEDIFFNIIIPNYNNAEWLNKSLNSVLTQTYTNYKIIFIDDVSTDNSLEIAQKLLKNHIIIPLTKKHFNGGSRNVGIKKAKELRSDYIVFLDSDDFFIDRKCLQKIRNIIIDNNKPDCISLSYNCLIGDNASYQPLIRNTRKELVESVFVACWTKCIKTDLVELFPENTLMEDVVQHIHQCDKLNTFASCYDPIIMWNRNNLNSCSRIENQNLQQGKWQSSMYRYAADLMDLQCEHPECEEHRKWRLSVVQNNIKEDKYIQ